PSAGYGIPTAVNTGMAVGTAPYLARQDADDESLPRRLQAELTFLEGNSGIGLVETGFDIVVGKRTVMSVVRGPEGMLDQNPFCTGTTSERSTKRSEATVLRCACFGLRGLVPVRCGRRYS